MRNILVQIVFLWIGVVFGCTANDGADTCRLHSDCLSGLCLEGACIEQPTDSPEAGSSNEMNEDSSVAPGRSDTGRQSSTESDCRNDGRGCTAPSECRRSDDGNYECLESDNNGETVRQGGREGSAE